MVTRLRLLGRGVPPASIAGARLHARCGYASSRRDAASCCSTVTRLRLLGRGVPLLPWPVRGYMPGAATPRRDGAWPVRGYMPGAATPRRGRAQPPAAPRLRGYASSDGRSRL